MRAPQPTPRPTPSNGRSNASVGHDSHRPGALPRRAIMGCMPSATGPAGHSPPTLLTVLSSVRLHPPIRQTHRVLIPVEMYPVDQLKQMRTLTERAGKPDRFRHPIKDNPTSLRKEHPDRAMRHRVAARYRKPGSRCPGANPDLGAGQRAVVSVAAAALGQWCRVCGARGHSWLQGVRVPSHTRRCAANPVVTVDPSFLFAVAARPPPPSYDNRGESAPVRLAAARRRVRGRRFRGALTLCGCSSFSKSAAGCTAMIGTSPSAGLPARRSLGVGWCAHTRNVELSVGECCRVVSDQRTEWGCHGGRSWRPLHGAQRRRTR